VTRLPLSPLAVALAGALAGALPGALPGVAVAQGLRLAGGGLGYAVQNDVRYLGVIHEQTGMLVGGEGQVRIGPLEVGGRGMMGTLKGGGDLSNPDRKVRFTTVWAAANVGSWLAVGAEMEARRYDSPVGVTVLQLLGGRARLAQQLGLDGLVASVDVTYFASAKATGIAAPTLALRAEVGTTFSPGNGPLTLRVGYRLERFDFPAGAAGTPSAGSPRLEQARGLVVGVGVRLGRR